MRICKPTGADRSRTHNLARLRRPRGGRARGNEVARSVASPLLAAGPFGRRRPSRPCGGRRPRWRGLALPGPRLCLARGLLVTYGLSCSTSVAVRVPVGVRGPSGLDRRERPEGRRRGVGRGPPHMPVSDRLQASCRRFDSRCGVVQPGQPSLPGEEGSGARSSVPHACRDRAQPPGRRRTGSRWLGLTALNERERAGHHRRLRAAGVPAMGVPVAQHRDDQLGQRPARSVRGWGAAVVRDRRGSGHRLGRRWLRANSRGRSGRRAKDMASPA